jgi:hypothetical protein
MPIAHSTFETSKQFSVGAGQLWNPHKDLIDLFVSDDGFLAKTWLLATIDRLAVSESVSEDCIVDELLLLSDGHTRQWLVAEV